LQSATAGDEEPAPSIDEVQWAAFSRPGGSKGKRSSSVYFVMVAFYAASVVLLLIGLNFDKTEQRKRLERALVPEESVPCAVAEAYYYDDQLLELRNPKEISERHKRMTFFSFIIRYLGCFGGVLTRQHLFMSFFVRSIPMFSRMKRGVLIVLQLHICVLTASMALCVNEHVEPTGGYKIYDCEGEAKCTATLPLSIFAAALMCPLFRYICYQPMRLTSFNSQTHPSSSLFPLNVQKFAYIRSKSTLENVLCMRNNFERLKAQALRTRSVSQRFLHALWRTTQPSIKDLRFYTAAASYMILFMAFAVIIGTVAYVHFITAFFKEEVVYHWIASTVCMFACSTFFFEPLLIFLIEVLWCAAVQHVAQQASLGSSALAATTRYKEVVRQVDAHFVADLQRQGAERIQHWWLAVLDMYRAINEQTAAAIKIQSVRKALIHQKKYTKERKWCMRVKVVGVTDLHLVELDTVMSPQVKLQCDVGNPTEMVTTPKWEMGQRADIDETFLVDIKESNALYVSVWSKGLNHDEFVGRGYFELGVLKNLDDQPPEGHHFPVTMYDMQHGESRPKGQRPGGKVHLCVEFLDPLKDKTGQLGPGEFDWMLPKNRMQFALSKMGGKARVGKMLGSLPRDGGQASQAASAIPVSLTPQAVGRPMPQMPGAMPEEP
jgi:hypothetical protein